jgi:hypothetical protein
MAQEEKDKKEQEQQEQEEKWADVNEDYKYVIHGGKVQCKYASPPMADINIIETPATVMLQDKPWATINDNNGKVNFNFTGVCNHPSQKKPFSPPPPCKAIINLGKWKNYSDTIAGDSNALLKKSTIPCTISNEDIKIIDSGQHATLTDVKPKTKRDPKIVEVYWINEAGKQLDEEIQDILGSTKAVCVPYGTKVKLAILTEDIPDGETLNIKINATNLPVRNPAIKAPPALIKAVVKSNRAEAEDKDAFYLNLLWYNEEAEEYNVKSNFLTTINAAKATTLKAEVTYKNKTLTTPPLIPAAYTSNYEEWIGLPQNAAGTNSMDNFISKDDKIKDIANSFMAAITDEANYACTADNFAATFKIETTARNLWNTAVAQVKSGTLDDRPLYWVRLKMQAWLKRHPAFKLDKDYNKNSQVIKGSNLDKIITLFEEKSRNYTDIKFISEIKIPLPVTSLLQIKIPVKKVLITGFDPFQLDLNILQSNPSGVVALALNGDATLGAYIQTMVVPVRYTDFDGSQENNKGQGEGIIEKYIKPFINQVDMIVTVSQAGPNQYHIDVFATATRAGHSDNMSFTRINDSKSVSLSAPETIVTTLPGRITQGKSKAVFYGAYYQKSGGAGIATINNYPKGKVYSGPGSNYLSNEIFYRVAKLREENADKNGNKGKLPTGHFHIAKLQADEEDLNPKDIQNLLSVVKQAIQEGIKGL